MGRPIIPEIPMDGGPPVHDVAVQRTWRSRADLSSISGAVDRFLGRAGFDRGPWLTIFFAAGIGAWFTLGKPWQWSTAIGAALLAAIAAAALWREQDNRAELRLAVTAVALVFAAGIAVVWARSEMVGAQPLERPQIMRIEARVLARENQPAQDRVRLILAMRDPAAGIARKIRVNVPENDDDELIGTEIGEGAIIRLRVRLMPPASPMLPGGYDFARSAWFQGFAATGSVMGEIEIIEPATPGGSIAKLQRRLASHVRSQLDGSPGSIAAAFASGDRGGIPEADEDAMRDSGLTHLLSISGLHVSAVIAAAYLLAIRLLALWPWLTLRVRLPVLAAGIGALAGIGYTLLTGSEVPTVRSCVGAVLVLIALALGREPLSLRMVATAALFVLLLWPESLIGPSFQMSFAAVLAIVALHNCAPVRGFLAPREESWLSRMGRRAFMLLVTGMVIEIALMPIVMFHFHRAGVYGAFANVIAIPLVTFLSMPLIAIALVLDSVGLGAPVWWLAGKSLELLLAIAHWTADRPGAVKLLPEMGGALFALFVAGGLWLALWQGRVRLLGLVPAALAALLMALKPAPDLLVSGDGRHVGIAGEGNRLLVLRGNRSSFASDNLLEMAGMNGTPLPLTEWPGADCSREFCVVTLTRGGRLWHVLMARGRELVDERALAAACDRSDIVIADRYLPFSCQPRWLKADRNLLGQTGGLSIYLGDERFDTVAASQGEHGWWRPAPKRPAWSGPKR
ncbi:ComEC/Rec2 family competence protein [Allopontixanthobacter sp.]|uniref:ComEC/Rec2 family competence protein n=1 Tax=Allopontixanthobacter sp. TaxID=2906452 RepID=UPI002ABB53E2|nr:ComEC/Rec2 family competence protein [Allopontixanthobacter sp.]MDZ4306563.1 ComEC/Rec2 family competence protein [Allopontixanthobacter sp.]